MAVEDLCTHCLWPLVWGEVHKCKPMPGNRLFKCDCGHEWYEPTRDCMSPSIDTCKNCSCDIQPYGRTPHPEWPVDGSGNLLNVDKLMAEARTLCQIPISEQSNAATDYDDDDMDIVPNSCVDCKIEFYAKQHEERCPPCTLEHKVKTYETTMQNIREELTKPVMVWDRFKERWTHEQDALAVQRALSNRIAAIIDGASR